MKKLNFDKLNLAEVSRTLRSIKRNRIMSKINSNQEIKQKLDNLAKMSLVLPMIKVRDSRNNYPVLVKEKPQPVKQTQKERFYDWLIKCGNVHTADAQRMDLALDSIIEY